MIAILHVAAKVRDADWKLLVLCQCMLCSATVSHTHGDVICAVGALLGPLSTTFGLAC